MASDPSSYVSGIPVKISERFRPPRKVTIPSYLSLSANEQLLSTEYDFEYERATLLWIAHKNSERVEALEIRKERLKKYEEEKKLEEEVSQTEDTESEIKEKAECDVLNKKEDKKESDSVVEECNTKCPDTLHHEGAANNTNVVTKTKEGLETLTPTPFPNSNLNPAKHKTAASINYSDFEGDANDPFDIVSLKSINDMEELAKVLECSNFPATKNILNYDGLNNAKLPFSGNKCVNNYAHNITNETEYFNALQSPTHCPSRFTSTLPYNPSVNSQLQHWNSYLNKTVDTSTCTQNTMASNIDSISIAASELPIILDSSSVLQKNYSIVNKRPDLEDFYSKYYAGPKESQVHIRYGARSGDSTPGSSYQCNLRPSHSVPDLSVSGDSKLPDLMSLPKLSSAFCSVKIDSDPARPSSTDVRGLEDWKPFPELPDNFECGVRNSPTYLKSNFKTRLPDPFEELDQDAQFLVQNVSEMGFPRPRVSRAVQKLGTDHKKLVEVILFLQSLHDSGEDEYQSERAFYHYNGSVDKTKECLSTSKQLLDLGFDEEHILTVLLKYDNNRDKALEELIA